MPGQHRILTDRRIEMLRYRPVIGVGAHICAGELGDRHDAKIGIAGHQHRLYGSDALAGHEPVLRR